MNKHMVLTLSLMLGISFSSYSQGWFTMKHMKKLGKDAAAGNKEVSAGQGRTAAICALENYPNTETYALLQRIATTEDNPAVVTAALRTLEQMEKSTPILAETATSKAHTGMGL